MRPQAVLVAAALAFAAIGCGNDTSEPSTPRSVSAAGARLDPNKDPHNITCGDLADKVASGALSRRAQFALAAEARVKDMSRLRVAQSIFFGMTELCKGAELSYTPAADAVRGVERGNYIADLDAP